MHCLNYAEHYLVADCCLIERLVFVVMQSVLIFLYECCIFNIGMIFGNYYLYYLQNLVSCFVPVWALYLVSEQVFNVIYFFFIVDLFKMHMEIGQKLINYFCDN